MNDLLDIYSKLIIGVLSFIAPIIVYMLSVFSDGAAIIRRRGDTLKSQIGELLIAQMNSQETSTFDHKIVDKSNKELKANEKQTNRRIRLLNPKRQIIRIFSSLILALLFVMAQRLIKDNELQIYNHNVSVCLLFASGISFVVALLILRQVAWAIIDTKQMIGQEKSAVSVGSQTP